MFIVPVAAGASIMLARTAGTISADSALGVTKLVCVLEKHASEPASALTISVSGKALEAQHEHFGLAFATACTAQQPLPVSVSVRHNPCGSAPQTETATSVKAAQSTRNFRALRSIVIWRYRLEPVISQGERSDGGTVIRQRVLLTLHLIRRINETFKYGSPPILMNPMPHRFEWSNLASFDAKDVREGIHVIIHCNV
jgi:hypothetical protein